MFLQYTFNTNMKTIQHCMLISQDMQMFLEYTFEQDGYSIETNFVL